MKIAWIQDHCPAEHSVLGAGAESNDWNHIKYGIKLGYEIDLITPQNFQAVNFEAYDFFIVSNCTFFTQQQLKKIMQYEYIVFNHDYFFCKWRLYFQADEKCHTCMFLPFWKKFYSNAKLNIFLSPYHKKMHEKVLGKIKPFAIVPSAIDINRFKPSEVEPSPNTVICVNSLYDFKGRKQVLEYIEKHKEKKFSIYGTRAENIALPSNAEFKGFIPNSKMPREYQKHEFLLHLPITDPFCRVVAEFLLCNPKGKLICNENIGLLSYKEIWKNGKIDRSKLKELIKNAPKKFWSEIK